MTTPLLSVAPARAWVAAVATFVVSLVALAVVGAPSPPLFAAMSAGGVLAVRADAPIAFPGWMRATGMLLVGVAAGASVDLDVLRTVAGSPLVVAGGVLATFVASMAAGQLLRLRRDVSGSTAAFASIAGGASGVSLMADEFGADAPTVMALQYLRVVVVMVSVPLVAPMLGTGEAAAGAAVEPADAALSVDLGYTGVAIVAGLVLTRLIRFSASDILLPLLAASALAVAGVFPDAVVPGWVVSVGYAVVGLNVGIGFTSERLRRLTRLLPIGLVQTAIGVALCAVVGVGFASAVGISRLDGYLATSPGGLPAVIAVAVDSSDEIGLILTMQFVRVFLALLCAPLVGNWLRRRSTR